jgi:Tfp pilus assembly protein PilO
MPYNYKTERDRYRRYYQSLEPILNKPKSKAYTTIVFSFLVVSLFGWYAIRPTVQTILYLKREIKDKTEINKKMEDKIAALIEAQTYYQEVEPFIPAIDQALPSIPDAIPLMIQLRNLASSSGVLVTSIQFPPVPIAEKEQIPTAKIISNAPQKITNKQQAFNFSISISGPYSNIRSFVEGIISLRRIISIDAIAIIPSKNESIASTSAIPSGRLLQLALKLKSYYLGE